MAAKRSKPAPSIPPAFATPRPAAPVRAPAAVWIMLGLLFFSMIAAWGLFMKVPGVRAGGQEFSNDRAIFLVVNCGTLTGFRYTIGVNDFNPDHAIGPIVALAVTLVGVLATLILSGLAAVRILRLPYDDRKVISSAAVITALAAIGGAIVLGIGRPPGQYGMAGALFQSTCAFGNCGLVMGQIGALLGWRLYVVLLPLAAAGGLGLPVLMELYDWAVNRRPISRHASSTIFGTAALYLIGTLVLVLFFWPTAAAAPSPPVPADQYRDAIGQASALSADARTLGFPLAFDALSRPGQWWLVLLMAIGAGSAGTAGGLKVTNLLVVGGGFRKSLRGELTAAGGKVFGIACAWLGCYALIAGACWMALLQLEPQIPADRLAFLAVSAASNVGLATETVTIVSGGLWVLSATMLLGRLMPIVILWWMARATPEAELLAA